jgi:hypothetical protein
MTSDLDPLDVLSALVLDGGQPWGATATDWQRADAEAVLDLDGPRMHFLTRPRGGSKSTDAAGMAIAALLAQAPPRSTSHVFARDRDQSGRFLDIAAGLVERTGLGGLLDVETWSLTAKRTGARLVVESADVGSAFGARPYLVVVDELAAWPDVRSSRALWEAVISGLPKRPDSRLIVITSAGDPAHWSRKVLDGALASDKWRVSQIPGPLPWMDPSDLAEQRHLLLPSSYDRLHLNQWSSGEDRLVSSDDYDACCTHEGVLGPDTGQTPYVIGADLGLRIDRTVLSVCHRHGDTIVLDRQIVMQGTSTDPVRLADIENALVSLVRDYHRAKVRIDPWQAAGLAQRLRDSGVSVEEWSFTTQSVGRLAANLHQLLREHRMSLPADDSGLRDELLNVRLRANSAGVIRLDHDAGHHDDRAVSLGLAALALVEKSTAGRASLSVPSFDMLDPVAAKPLREGLASHGITAASTGRRRTTPEGPSRQDLARGLRGLPWRH